MGFMSSIKSLGPERRIAMFRALNALSNTPDDGEKEGGIKNLDLVWFFDTLRSDIHGFQIIVEDSGDSKSLTPCGIRCLRV